ncbi:hypothetical protein BZA70DRAFT_295563 [Myxozyma melibiosi]|uniref:beta-galactosidase n=1 Tax=Myxozyma melibiosi TaxID=54550 RepID=A0ABR1F5H2_9ASCO
MIHRVRRAVHRILCLCVRREQQDPDSAHAKYLEQGSPQPESSSSSKRRHRLWRPASLKGTIFLIAVTMLMIVQFSFITRNLMPYSDTITNARAYGTDLSIAPFRRRPTSKTDNRLKHHPESKNLQWDNNVLWINKKPTFIISGEFHYWRMPSQSMYLDVFQKMRAMGLNTVSLSFNWGYHHVRKDKLLFVGVGRDVQALFEAAQRAGLYVIVRPGPYIDAQASAGGIPAWLLNSKNIELRNLDSEYTKAWKDYLVALMPIVARYQIDKGGTVIAVQLEHEMRNCDLYPDAHKYIETLSYFIRDQGIIVPVFHNDMNQSKSFTPSDFPGTTDLYGIDSYPLGSHCGEMAKNFPQVSDYRKYLRTASASSPKFITELQAGGYDSWAGDGYDDCARRTSTQYVNIFFREAIAQKFTMISQYMAAGGTNWGGIGSPDVYSSYDFGAAITETRLYREKANEQKLLWTFVRCSPSLALAEFVEDSRMVPYSDNPDVFVTELRDPASDAGFYVIRHNDTSGNEGSQYRLIVNTVDHGVMQIPSSGVLSLLARESKIFITDYAAGPKLTLVYSTLEVFTWTYFNGKPLMVLYGALEDLNEISIKNAGHIKFNFYKIRDAKLVKFKDFGSKVTELNELRVLFALDGEQRAVLISDEYMILMINRPDIYRAWAPSLGNYVDPSLSIANQLIVLGPHLVRNISETGTDNKGLEINGDVDLESSDGGFVEVFVEDNYEHFSWNGEKIMHFRRTEYGSFLFEVTRPSANLAQVAIQPFDTAQWAAIDSLPELNSGFDDSAWVKADKQVSNNKYFPARMTPVLYPGDYGFYSGVVLYRGRFTGSEVSGINLEIWGGKAFAFAVWLNGKFVGSFPGERNTDRMKREMQFPEGAVTEGENVLLIVADQMGYDHYNDAKDDGGEAHAIFHPRGIRLIELLPSNATVAKTDFSSWKLQGNVGADQYDDLLRAPYNEGGLYGLRVGGHLPGNPVSNWQGMSPIITDLAGELSRNPRKEASVRFYRAEVSVRVPQMMDISLGIRIKGVGIRAELFVNGWQFGKYISDLGPQDEFPIPPGILNTLGKNVVALQIWALNNTAMAGVLEFEWVRYGLYSSGFGPVPHDDYHGWYVDRTAQVAKYDTGK